MGGHNLKDTSANLFLSWKYWAEQAEEFVGPQKRFSQKLEDRGFKPHKTNGQRLFLGLKVDDKKSAVAREAADAGKRTADARAAADAEKVPL